MMVNHAIKHAPSPFHVQSCRAIVLLGEDHEKLWDFGYEATKKSLPPHVFENHAAKIKGFRDAYGTVSYLLLKTQNFHLDVSTGSTMVVSLRTRPLILIT
jgi:predicted oxidoreductase (fatty acid repression mutant protein)